MTRHCLCCGAEVKIMCEQDYCSSRCREGKCDHVRVIHDVRLESVGIVADALPQLRFTQPEEAGHE